MGTTMHKEVIRDEPSRPTQGAIIKQHLGTIEME